MPKYLLQATYEPSGLQGIIKEGGSSRAEAVRAAVESLGGTMESFHFAFGDVDVFCIVDFPDAVSALTASLVGNAAGTNKTTFVVLATPEEVDAAAKRAQKSIANYRPPGQ